MQWRKKDYTQWHKWFAWVPVLAGDTYIWLEVVWRRQTGRAWDYSEEWGYKQKENKSDK